MIDLHHAEVIEQREKRSDENDRRQYLEGKDETHGRSCRLPSSPNTNSEPTNAIRQELFTPSPAFENSRWPHVKAQHEKREQRTGDPVPRQSSSAEWRGGSWKKYTPAPSIVSQPRTSDRIGAHRVPPRLVRRAGRAIAANYTANNLLNQRPRRAARSAAIAIAGFDKLDAPRHSRASEL